MRVRHFVLLALAVVSVVSTSGQEVNGSDQGDCKGEPSAYRGRTVADVHVTSPFDFIRAVRTLNDRAKETLPLKKGDSFGANAYSDGTAALTTYIRAGLPSSLVSFRLVAVHSGLEPNKGGPPDCSAGPVIVHYSVFTVLIPRSSANLSEIAQGLTENPSGNAGAMSTNALLGILPNVNYNHTRRAFAGLTMNQAVPFKVFDHIEADPAVSPNSTTGTAELTGSANPAKKYLDRANWVFGTQYYDVPVDSASVTKGLLSAEAFAATKQLASTITLRWGAEVGGGHVQDGTGETANSSYGEMKLLTGIDAQRGTITGSATYGLEVGRPISRSTGTFEKHIFDARFAWTYAPLPKYVTSHGKADDDRRTYIGTPHYPLSIEAQANGGVITGSAAVPSVERFLGGNQERPFVPGQPWDARSQPFIRSIPENRLGTATGADVIGGNRFYSANLTIGKVIRAKALVPPDLARKDFLDHLDGAINTAKGELSDAYYSKDPGVAGFTDLVRMLDEELAGLKLPTAVMNLPSVKPIKSELNKFLIGSRAAVAFIKSGHANVMPNLINTQLPGLEGDLDRLTNAAKAAGDMASATVLQKEKSALDDELKCLKSTWGALDTKGVRKRANARAETDFMPAETVLNSILYTLDSYSVAPVAIFDVARIWPELHGTRYALGGGMRLSIVNANFTCGYAFNPTHANHEGVGAVFFKLDFTDLFR